MYPDERSLVKKYGKRGFVIVGVNSDDSLETLQKANKNQKLTWTSFFDGGGTGGPIATQWGVTGWPTVYLIDRKGIIRAKNLRSESRLAPEIERLLAIRAR